MYTWNYIWVLPDISDSLKIDVFDTIDNKWELKLAMEINNVWSLQDFDILFVFMTIYFSKVHGKAHLMLLLFDYVPRFYWSSD